MPPEAISSEEKRRALDRVLQSRTFRRSDQLRNFLHYVCEAELEGRTHELNEYAVGVAVLGRKADYSPAEDSSVRTRAYELRNKLNHYYVSESPDEPIIIRIDKGAYVPRFERIVIPTPGIESVDTSRFESPSPPTNEPSMVLGATPPSSDVPLPDPGRALPTSVATVPESSRAPSTSVATVPESSRAPSTSVATLPESISAPTLVRRSALIVAVLLTVAVCGVCLFFLVARHDASKANLEEGSWTAEMRSLWKPFLQRDVPLLISFDIRLFFYAPSTGLVVRDFATNQTAELTNSKPLASFRERMGADELRETFDYADFGVVHAAFLLGRLLGTERTDIGLKHSNTLGWEDFWNSSIIFVGKPTLNPSIRYLLSGRDFVQDEHGVIHNLHPRPGEAAQYRSADTHGAGEKYALITVSAGPQPGRHLMILGGSGAELMWALAEAVTNPTRVQELVSHVRLPSGECAPTFQLVLRADFESNVPVKISYVTHRI